MHSFMHSCIHSFLLENNTTKMTIEPVKKKNLFTSLGKVLRKRAKPKSKSMTDLSHQVMLRSQKNDTSLRNSDSFHSSKASNSDHEENLLNSLLDVDSADGGHHNSHYDDHSGAEDVEQSSIASSQDVHETIDEDNEEELDEEENETVEHTKQPFGNVPPGTTVRPYKSFFFYSLNCSTYCYYFKV